MNPIPRVVNSYNNTPCTYLRPDGTICNQIHERCRGHLRNGPRIGDPCSKPAAAGLTICTSHGANNLPEAKRVYQRERARRALGILVGDTPAPVDDPVSELSRVLGQMRDISDGLAELLAQAQANAENPSDALTVIDPSTGSLRVHPLFDKATEALAAYQKALVEANKLGLAERHVEVEEEQVRLVQLALVETLRQRGIDPSTVLPLLAENLRTLEGVVDVEGVEVT